MSEELTTTALKEEEFNKKVDMKVWKRLLAYGLRQKKLLIPLIVFMFIVAAIDLVYPQLSRYAIDSIIMQGDIKRLIPFAAVYFIVIALQSFGTVMFISRAGKLEMAIAYDIRQDAFKKLQDLSFSYYDKTAVGYIMARMIGDIPRLSDMIAWSLTDILWSGGFVINELEARPSRAHCCSADCDSVRMVSKKNSSAAPNRTQTEFPHYRCIQ